MEKVVKVSKKPRKCPKWAETGRIGVRTPDLGSSQESGSRQVSPNPRPRNLGIRGICPNRQVGNPGLARSRQTPDPGIRESGESEESARSGVPGSPDLAKPGKYEKTRKKHEFLKRPEKSGAPGIPESWEFCARAESARTFPGFLGPKKRKWAGIVYPLLAPGFF